MEQTEVAVTTLEESCEGCGEVHDPMNPEKMREIHKKLQFRFRLFTAGYLTSVAGGLIALSLFNYFLGAFGVCVFFAYFFHVNMASAGDGSARVGDLLKMSDIHAEMSGKKTDDTGHGQYV